MEVGHELELEGGAGHELELKGGAEFEQVKR